MIAAVKSAVTDCAEVMVTVQVVLVPEQAPPQPVKLAPVVGMAVKVTAVFAANASLQSAPQSMPAGELVMPPSPVTIAVKL